MSTNVLLLGGGGREHAIAWKLAQSPRFAALWTAPGNAGTAAFGENLPDVAATDVDAVVAAAQRLGVDLVVVAPEDPLAAGVADRLAAEGVPVFGPTRAAAEIESSKSFAKELMAGAGIATGRAVAFDDIAAANECVRGLDGDGACVVKAEGLAAGKGVTVCDSAAQAVAAIDRAMRHRAFGEAGARVLVEERLHGPEDLGPRPSPTARPSRTCRSAATTSPSSTATAAPTPAAWASTPRPSGSTAPPRARSSATSPRAPSRPSAAPAVRIAACSTPA